MDLRYYLPLLILSVAVAVLPVVWAAHRRFNKKRIIAALAILILFAAACLGYPSRSGYNTWGVNRFQAWDALHFTTPPRQSPWFVAQEHFAKLLSPQPGVVLADIDPLYLNSLLPNSFAAAPIDGNHPYKWTIMWRYDQPQALALVKRSLAQSLPIYALFTSMKEMEVARSRLPVIPEHDWMRIDDSNRKAIILKLVPLE